MGNSSTIRSPGLASAPKLLQDFGSGTTSWQFMYMINYDHITLGVEHDYITYINICDQTVEICWNNLWKSTPSHFWKPPASLWLGLVSPNNFLLAVGKPKRRPMQNGTWGDCKETGEPSSFKLSWPPPYNFLDRKPVPLPTSRNSTLKTDPPKEKFFSGNY